MIDTSVTPEANPPEPSVEKVQSKRSSLWEKIALATIMLVSIFCNFYQLGQNGFGNLFYASGVRSMADSLYTFFFVSYDPGGFVTLDKPPLGFWLQAICVKLFGFTPFSIFLPQALAGVLAVLVLYLLVKRHFGPTAGLLAALALAISPISVVTNRNNTIDSTLALTLLLGAWAILLAAETGKWRWLLLSAAAIGVGFNVKMLEAWLVIPAFGLLYLLAAPRKIWFRLVQLLVAVVVMLVISLSWVGIVDLVPASQRPYVGSSQNNSEISLAFGYNGAERLLGNAQGGNSGTNGTGSFGIFGNVGGLFGLGQPGPFRLFTTTLAGQIAWLLPFALLAMLALSWQGRPRFSESREQQSLVLWGTWLLTMGIFFSVADFFHQYYMAVFAPAICALFGIGVVVMWRDYRRGGWRGWLLPLALLVTALEQVSIIMNNPDWGSWLVPVIALSCALVALALIVVRLIPRLTFGTPVLAPVLSIGICALLLTPAIWSALPSIQVTVADLPVAGPEQGSRFAGFGGTTVVDNKLISYLLANQGKTKYLLATSSSITADAFILTTNKPIMAMGGFIGTDPILTATQLQGLVANGTVRFFLLDQISLFLGRFNDFFGRNGRFGDLPGPVGGGNVNIGTLSNLSGWIQQNCSSVPASAWQSAAGGPSQLYDCQAKK